MDGGAARSSGSTVVDGIMFGDVAGVTITGDVTEVEARCFFYRGQWFRFTSRRIMALVALGMDDRGGCDDVAVVLRVVDFKTMAW